MKPIELHALLNKLEEGQNESYYSYSSSEVLSAIRTWQLLYCGFGGDVRQAIDAFLVAISSSSDLPANVTSKYNIEEVRELASTQTTLNRNRDLFQAAHTFAPFRGI